MKSSEDFRAAVYERARREQARITARRQKMRNVSLSAVVMLLVAGLAIPLARNTGSGANPGNVQNVSNPANRGGSSSRMLLLVGTESGDTQAVMLENNDQQKQFVSQYKEALNLGDDEALAMTPEAADTVQTIRSREELAAYLAQLPKAVASLIEDYDESFFRENELCAMPMALPAQSDDPAAEETTVQSEATAAVEMLTIPDSEPTESGEPTEAAQDQTTKAQQTQSLPANEAMQNGDVKVLLLVPVNKEGSTTAPTTTLAATTTAAKTTSKAATK